MIDAERSPLAVRQNDVDLKNWETRTRSVDELEEEIAELCTHIDAATYRLLRAIAEFDRREAWGCGFQSTAHWLAWRVGIDMVTAREKVRVARALEGLPQINDTFRQGKVSYSKVRAMTRIATPENEGYLLYIAENGTASDLESLVRAYRRASRGEDLEEARRHREERYLDMYTDEDGMVVIRGRLPQEIAAVVEKALEAHHIEHWAKGGETTPENLVLLCKAHTTGRFTKAVCGSKGGLLGGLSSTVPMAGSCRSALCP
jgi:hypothetical protein